jgi:CRISPR-associated endonuclease/helicase Cas3
MMVTNALFRLWGKTNKNSTDSNDFHCAIFHMLDVGNIAREMLSQNTPPRWRHILSETLNINAERLVNIVPYIVALHDIGKISMAFQGKNDQQKARLQREGFLFRKTDIRHTVISQIFIADSLSLHTGTITNIPLGVDEALGGHHGRFVDPEDVKKARRYLKDESTEWQALRNNADSLLQKEFLFNEIQLSQPGNISTVIMAITGFTILCDWLGSDGRYFIPDSNSTFEQYQISSRNRAKQAVRGSGMLSMTTSEAPTDVKSLFEDLGSWRPLQLAIDTIPNDNLKLPSLTIIEAPTGEGKTEAALTLAHRIARIHGTDEMYYALPTTATSNQMYGRLKTHLDKRLGLATSIKLVHGQAFLVEDELRSEMPLSQIEPLEDGDIGKWSEMNEMITWFNSKKRALLAPFGVGTIDQAELAVLNVKHSALRMMGLVGKVVIIDEVHAYDTYMTTIIERLLCWLATMNTSVILLSATLPISRRQLLAKAFGIRLELAAEQKNIYPSILVMTPNGIYQSSPQVWQPNRTLELRELHWGDVDILAKAEWLVKAVANGGCICWITNTVKRAQRIFDALLSIEQTGIDLSLLHSQFPLDERQKREQILNEKYGRNGKRPNKGIIIGTQVLEQSLDLDFYMLVSDLAPIDLILQRAGRLHRHTRERPSAHNVPRLYINFEIEPDGELKPGSDRRIYALFLMHKTQKILAGRSQIRLPQDYRILIETLYSDQEPSKNDELYDTWKELQDHHNIAIGEAKQRLLPTPHPRDSFAKNAAMRVDFEEDENRADWIVAQTRLGGDSLNVIPINRDGNFASIPGENQPINTNQETSLDKQRKLLKRNLRISDPATIKAIRNDAERHPTQLFQNAVLLKGYYPLWLYNGKTELTFEHGKFYLDLNPELGLVIEKEGNLSGTK